MGNIIIYDFETVTSNQRGWGQIIQIGAIAVDEDLNELSRFNERCRLSPGIIPEAMAMIVSNTTPKLLKESNRSHYEMIRSFVKWIKQFKNSTFMGWNNLEFDQLYFRSTLFQNFEYPYLTTTNGAKEGDIMNLARAANLYYPGTLKNEKNSKGNLVYKLDSMSELNGVSHKEKHTGIGDCEATLGIAQIIKKKAPSVWAASMLTLNKDQALKIIKDEKLFCTNEYYYGKVVPFVQTFVCEHPVYKGWAKNFDLKHDPSIYINMPVEALKQELKKTPKILRTCRSNKHVILMNPSYIDNFEEYKMIGVTKLIERANMIKNNKKFAEKIELILRDEAEEKAQTASQEDLYEEESLYNFPPAEDNRLMEGFHQLEWEKRLPYLKKFKDKRFHYFGKKLIYQEKPELLSKEDYDEIHSTVVKRVLSTNNEPWNTIPRVYAEIDTLREKFEKSKETEKLKMLEDINVYVEELEKNYSRA